MHRKYYIGSVLHEILELLRVASLHHTQMKLVGTDFCSLQNLNTVFLFLCEYDAFR